MTKSIFIKRKIKYLKNDLKGNQVQNNPDMIDNVKLLMMSDLTPHQMQ